MKRQYFGTDGVRGVANAKLTPELAFQLGAGAAQWMRENGEAPVVVIGRDTRRSGPMLEAALSAGFAAYGVDVDLLGIAPTPLVSYATRTGRARMGIVVSASHNPAPDNGIKFMGHDGRKLPDETEFRIEQLMSETANRPTGVGVGLIAPADELTEAYLEFLMAQVPERLDGMRVVVDGANGAAYQLGPEVLRRLGAEVIAINVDPADGMAINATGGATKPKVVQAATAEAKAHIGVAFDGDADRVIFSDGDGNLINGDRTIALWAAHEHAHGQLKPPVVVGTVMSNGGVEAYLTGLGIQFERTNVGDKYVAQRLESTGSRVGGEQSGHIIFPAYGPTGDGLTTMLQVLRVLRVSGRTAAEVYRDFDNWPQLLVNIAVESKDGWEALLAEDLAAAETRLAGRGRVNVRPSGTSPLLRVMVEADDAVLRDEIADSLTARLVDGLRGHVEGRIDLTHDLGD
ncbi:MAG: phosphoglucosamine mutase [Fimbriimonadaceae bacterium]|nr:phosphoglucosamine mutase [Fimbriimonadaceae bacterium]